MPKHLEENGHYACNQATRVNKAKITSNKGFVTCANCVKRLNREIRGRNE